MAGRRSDRGDPTATGGMRDGPAAGEAPADMPAAALATSAAVTPTTAPSTMPTAPSTMPTAPSTMPTTPAAVPTTTPTAAVSQGRGRRQRQRRQGQGRHLRRARDLPAQSAHRRPLSRGTCTFG
jgi:hypothetical protein